MDDVGGDNESTRISRDASPLAWTTLLATSSPASSTTSCLRETGSSPLTGFGDRVPGLRGGAGAALQHSDPPIPGGRSR